MYLLNGESRHCIDVADRGFQYGDGLFETLEVENSRPLLLDAHLDRLQSGCERLLIPMPDRHLLKQEAEQVSKGVEHAVLKLIVTRGQGGRGYRQPKPIHTTRLFSLHPYPAYPASLQRDGIVARFCHHRLGINPGLAGIKHLNRLEQIMARAEWQDDGVQEGLMLNADGFVIEGTMSNLFYVKNRKLVTSPIDRCGVAGIIRALVIHMASQLLIAVEEEYFGPEMLLQADEIFVTNSVVGIWPIRSLAGQQFAIGSVTKQLQNAYQQLKRQTV